MLTHGDTGLPTSQWLMLTLEQAQLEVGIGGPLLEAPYEQYEFLCTDSWIKALWRFVSTYNITLEDRTLKLPPLQWEGNEFLMECLVLSNRFNEAALIRINWCQIKKQVLTMADVISGDGVHLQRDAHAYIPRVGLEPSKYVGQGRNWHPWIGTSGDMH